MCVGVKRSVKTGPGRFRRVIPGLSLVRAAEYSDLLSNICIIKGVMRRYVIACGPYNLNPLPRDPRTKERLKPANYFFD